MDTLIEKKEGKTIKNIFDTNGEKYFRNLEKKEAIKYLKREKLIIALGGGAFVNPEIRKEVLKNTISFWLDINIRNLIKRKIIVKKRPLLSGNNLEQTLSEIYNARKNIQGLANFKIECNKSTKVNVAKKILGIYENLQN